MNNVANVRSMEGFPLEDLQILFSLQMRKLRLEGDQGITHTHLEKRILVISGWCLFLLPCEWDSAGGLRWEGERDARREETKTCKRSALFPNIPSQNRTKALRAAWQTLKTNSTYTIPVLSEANKPTKSVKADMRATAGLWRDGLLSRFFWLQVTENLAHSSSNKSSKNSSVQRYLLDSFAKDRPLTFVLVS